MNNYWIVVNTECNMRCAHCFEDSFKKKKIDISNIVKFMDKINESVSINLFGGEPTLDLEHFKQVVYTLIDTKKVHEIVVFTNGKFDLSILTDLLAFKDIIKWQISVQTCNQNVIGVKNQIATLLKIRELGYRFTISTIIVESEANLLDDFLEFVNHEKLFKNLYLAPNRLATDYNKYGDYVLNVIKKVIDYSFNGEERFNPVIVKDFLKSTPGCSLYGSGDASIYSTLGVDGKIYGCHHANNIKPTNAHRRKVLNTSIKIDDWEENLGFENRLGYDIKTSILTPCIMENKETDIAIAYEKMKFIRKEIKKYIKLKLEEVCNV